MSDTTPTKPTKKTGSKDADNAGETSSSNLTLIATGQIDFANIEADAAFRLLEGNTTMNLSYVAPGGEIDPTKVANIDDLFKAISDTFGITNTTKLPDSIANFAFAIKLLYANVESKPGGSKTFAIDVAFGKKDGGEFTREWQPTGGGLTLKNLNLFVTNMRQEDVRSLSEDAQLIIRNALPAGVSLPRSASPSALPAPAEPGTTDKA